MKDYSTLACAGESAVDYWIHLNKAIDSADECLRRRGRWVEDPSAETVMMFINNCPDHTSMRTAAAHDHNAVGFSAHSQSPVSGVAPVSLVVESVKRHNPDSLNTPPVASDVPAAPVQPATEPGLQQVVAMFDPVLSLSNASFNNKQRVSIFLRQANQPRT